MKNINMLNLSSTFVVFVPDMKSLIWFPTKYHGQRGDEVNEIQLVLIKCNNAEEIPEVMDKAIEVSEKENKEILKEWKKHFNDTSLLHKAEDDMVQMIKTDLIKHNVKLPKDFPYLYLSGVSFIQES